MPKSIGTLHVLVEYIVVYIVWKCFVLEIHCCTFVRI